MIKKCPVCDKCAVSLLTGDSEYWIQIPYYLCNSCGWIGHSHTIEKLNAMGLSAEPEVVYLVELLTLKPHQPHTEYSGEYRASGNSNLSHFYQPTCT